MKKIFLIPLLTLMCSITAWAEIVPVNVDSEAGMRTALEAAASQDSTEITLTGDINFNATSFVVPEGARVLLNLNGHSITSTYTCRGGCDMREDVIFWIKGLLHIVSEGNAIVSKPVGAGNFDSGSAIFAPDAGTLIIDGGIYLGGYCDAGEGFPLTVQLPIFWSYSYTEPERKSNIIINGGTFLTTTHPTMLSNFGMFQKEGISPNYSISGGIFSKTLDAGYLAANMETASVPYKNANISGYTTAQTVYAVVPTEGAQQITENTEINSDTEYAFLYVDPGKTLTIKDGKKLTIGDAGAILGGSDSKIIIEAGGTLVSGGDIVTSSEENLELTMDAVNDKYAQLMIKPNAIQDKHPDATVILKSKAYKKDGAYTWQRFAVPTYLDGDQSLTRANMLYDNTTYPTALYRWNYALSAENKWQVMLDDNEKFKPFDCYELTTNNTTKGGEYTFKCELVGNGDANLQLDNDRWSYFANSYTAPINIEEMLWELFTDATYKNNIAASVYVHNRADENWDLVSFADVLDERATIENIDPMQAFVLWKIAAIDDYTLHYEDVIYNPAMGIPSALHAPARRAQAGMDYQRASIVFSDENGKKDIVKLYEGSDFDNTLNNGFDVAKLMNEGQFSVYAVAEEGEMARLASDNIENATISMQTKGATTFTMSFENVKMEGYAVRDNLTGTTTEIKEGNTYHFSAPANAAVEGRFQVVAMPKITTAVENVENATATKGIYTLTGIYMGEDFNAVPAGIYIVNGKKMVK